MTDYNDFNDLKNNENSNDTFFGEEKKEEFFFKRDNKETATAVENVKNKKPRGKRVVSVALAVLLCIVSFLGGMLVGTIGNSDYVAAKTILEKINNNAYFATEEVTMEDIMLYGFANLLPNDPYYAFYDEEALKEQTDALAGRSTSFGMTVAELTGFEGVYVISVVKGSGADKAGVQVGYRLLEVNGINVWDYVLARLTPLILSIPDYTDTEFVFAVPDESGMYSESNLKTLTFQRTEYEPIVAEYYDNRSEGLESLLDADTAYIKLTSFVGKTASQFDAVMKTFKDNGKHALILDLRDNTGGSAENLWSVASHLLKNGEDKRILVMTERYKDGSVAEHYTNGCYYDDYGFEKIIVLTNDNTASASEALLAAMKDYGTVDVIIGTTTFGKGTGLQTFMFNQFGYGVTFTASYFYSPLGTSHDGVGITPTSGYVVSENLNNMPYRYSNDAELMRAINALK